MRGFFRLRYLLFPLTCQTLLPHTLLHNLHLLFGQSVKLINQAVDFGFKSGGVGGGVCFLIATQICFLHLWK